MADLWLLEQQCAAAEKRMLAQISYPAQREFAGPHILTARDGAQAYCDRRYCRVCRNNGGGC
jgi:hypothetical protein